MKSQKNKYWQTSKNKILVVTLIFAIIVVLFTVVTGQIAYGNAVGKLFNDSKVPKTEFVGMPMAYNSNGNSYLVFNVTDVDGPNQAAVTEIILSNSTSTIILTSQNIDKDVYKIVDAPYHYHDDVKVSPYNGIFIPLGDEAEIYMNLSTSMHMELHGTYTVKLITPTQKAAPASATVTF
ncbi:TQO small subunit DoxA domain-containing protein [Picrophilus oshimae]|uniref:Terminal quinol oxidase, subunit II n=1 Tax=Picrophilus torridus (strain ATCC 700027 / DSM 9790 / JCM 10055 / NBRC 100828 / KAW 2/3) TaxID=1122961 RepID=Q6L1R7_PICTO|nr:TQO small subunit DoxA domain-containing protein [Picrophilus oshimae]AAT43085.1 terminal quinol oxidase, subunit II [Picrophilus oshimae DSM 9789]SMD30608.1 thiosulfate dehydrogenase (quinone) subunit DoxA [Picrophilus oshimae DSM 9789]